MMETGAQDSATWQDDQCRHWLWRLRYSPDGAHAFCPHCRRRRRFHRLRSRSSYSCDACGRQLSPTSGTIFEKSSTPLPVWFRAIALVVEDAGAVSTGRLAAELGVSRSTAARMSRRIRDALSGAGGSGDEAGKPPDYAAPGRPRIHGRDVVARIAAEARGQAPGWTTERHGRASSAAAAGVRRGSGPRSRPRTMRAAANRQRILAAACTVIVRKGMAATRVADIAREAGLSSAIIHYYFATKDEVLFAAVIWQNERETARRIAIAESDTSPTAKLVRFLDASMPPRGFAREEALIRFDLWGRAMRERAYSDVLRPLREEWRRQFAAILRDGVATGEFRPDCPFEQTLEELTAILDGYSFQSILGYGWMTAPRLWDLLSDYARVHLGVPADAFAKARAASRDVSENV